MQHQALCSDSLYSTKENKSIQHYFDFFFLQHVASPLFKFIDVPCVHEDLVTLRKCTNSTSTEPNPCCKKFLESCTHLVNGLQKVKQSTRTPSLSVARIAAVLAVLVRQLGNPCPRIVLNVVARHQEHLIQTVESF